MKAKKADVYLYTRDTYKDYPDYYAADAGLGNGRRLTEANPQQKDFLWSSGSMLLDYKTDPKSGLDKPLQAALFLPANYEKGKSYPTIVYFYEKMSQQLNRYAQPSANGFNKSVYTSNGYAVLMPDITYKINDPGMSAVWCVLPAIDAAVAAGVVDRSKVGLQGHSWGGYQTAFLVTQADFAAAVAGAPLTNMISMYSSIYFNSGSANQPIFESSQGRFKGGYWDNLEAYQRNSPVYYAERVKHAAHHPAQRQGRRGRLEPGHRILQHAAPAQEAGRHARIRRREPRPAEAGQPEGLHRADEGVLRPLPHGQAGAGLVDRRRPLPRAQGLSQGTGQGLEAGRNRPEEGRRAEIQLGEKAPAGQPDGVRSEGWLVRRQGFKGKGSGAKEDPSPASVFIIGPLFWSCQS